MQTPTFEIENINDIIYIKAAGEIDLNNSNELKKIIENLLQNNMSKVIFNCQDIKYIDSSGLGILIRLKATFKSDRTGLKKDIVLISLSEEVEKVINLTKLDGFFTIMKDKDEALEYFKDF
jgi:anti-sigma B factor antagonist